MYRTVSAAFWTDKEVNKLTPECKAVLLYLITNPHSHVSGIYYLNLAYAQADLGMAGGIVSGHLDTLSILYPKQFCMFDTEKSVIWVKKMFFHQGMNDKTIRSAARHLMEDVHESVLCKPFLDAYPVVKTHLPAWGIDRLSGFGIPEQDPEQKIKTATAGVAKGDVKGDTPKKTSKKNKKFTTAYKADFEEFWQLSCRRGSKFDASKYWDSLPDEMKPQVKNAMTAAVKFEWVNREPEKIPHVTTWLNQRRWETVAFFEKPPIENCNDWL